MLHIADYAFIRNGGDGGGGGCLRVKRFCIIYKIYKHTQVHQARSSV